MHKKHRNVMNTYAIYEYMPSALYGMHTYIHISCTCYIFYIQINIIVCGGAKCGFSVRLLLYFFCIFCSNGTCGRQRGRGGLEGRKGDLLLVFMAINRTKSIFFCKNVWVRVCVWESWAKRHLGTAAKMYKNLDFISCACQQRWSRESRAWKSRPIDAEWEIKSVEGK